MSSSRRPFEPATVAATAPAALAEPAGFEQALDELDTLVRQMESGELGLDASIAAYRRAAELARYCQGRLANAEQEIRKLDGEVLKPLDPAELRGGGP
jgi:exodeoxyribonuclease VII small subunit